MIHGKKPEIKYISRKTAAEKLNLKLSEFEEICTLALIKPLIAKNKNKYDHADTLFYRIEDIQKMIDSDAYDVIIKRNEIAARKREYIKKRRDERLKNLSYVDFDYQRLVKERYKTIYESVVGLNDSLKILFIVKSHFFVVDGLENKCFMHDYTNLCSLLDEFMEFVRVHKMLENTFLTDRGMFYLARVNNIEILWNEPDIFYKSLEGSKNNFSRIKNIYKFAFMHLKLLLCKLKTMFRDNETEIKECGGFDFNSNNEMVKDRKTLINNQDIYEDIEQCTTKKDNKYETKNIGGIKQHNQNIFKDIKFYLEDTDQRTKYIINYCEGIIIDDYKNADFYITDNEIKDFSLEMKYVQPQFIYDCLNKKKLLDYTDYITGKELPMHECPFEKDDSLDFDPNLLQLLSKNERRKVDEAIKEINKHK